MVPVSRDTEDSPATAPDGTPGKAVRPPVRHLLLLGLPLIVALVAWGRLIVAAIGFGSQARSGDPTAWVLLGLATLGAAACLFVTLLLGARVLAVAQGRQAPARPRGGRRAAR